MSDEIEFPPKESIHDIDLGDRKNYEYKKPILDNVEQAIRNKKKYIIISVPTGGGKSHIAAQIAKWCHGATIVTNQKSLQDQYTRDFDFFNSVRGKRNFKCAKSNMSSNCENKDCNSCEYKITNEKIEISNYGNADDETISLLYPFTNQIEKNSESRKIEFNNSKLLNENADGSVKKENTTLNETKDLEAAYITAKKILEENDIESINSLENSWSFAIEKGNKIYFYSPHDHMIFLLKWGDRKSNNVSPE